MMVSPNYKQIIPEQISNTFLIEVHFHGGSGSRLPVQGSTLAFSEFYPIEQVD